MSNEFVGVIQLAFADLWSSLILFLPRFVGAIIVLIIGVIVANILRKVIMKISEVIKLDEIALKLEVKKAFEQSGVRLHIGKLLGWIIKWFFIVVFLIAAADILRWDQVTVFLRDVVLYLPNVIISVVILLVGVLLANFVNSIVRTAVEAAKLSSAAFLAGISKWAILIFSFMAALVQLGIAEDLI
ncbi:MAG: hypothetical protein O2877_02220, partial [bacterium]|nr:hypothetical protein [bacterium]